MDAETRESRGMPGMIALVALLASVGAALAPAQERGEDARPGVAEEATHHQVRTIAIPMGEHPVEIHTFCIDHAGNLLAATGKERTGLVRGADGLRSETVREPYGIRVIHPDGRLLATWKLDVIPQAVNVAPDGTVYFGGEGKVGRLGRDGQIVAIAEAPQVTELGPLPPLPSEIEIPERGPEEVAARRLQVAELGKRLDEARKSLGAAAAAVQAAEGDATQSDAASRAYDDVVLRYLKLNEELDELTKDPKLLASRRRSAAMRKRSVTGIAITEADVFVACPAAQGFGYDLWRLDRDLANPKKIVERMRGCCGQMDIQARDGKVYVAENGRYRVVTYDREGRKLASWGQGDRKGLVGFGSCCNPMNIRFGADGSVYTSEASLGRIKRFSVEGEFLGLVGSARIVPGCKHVAIGVSEDGARVFLLDITRNQIVVMERKEVGRELRLR